MSRAGAPGARPARLVVFMGTGTEVGKTWVACVAARALQARGLRVAARKPAQSYEANAVGGPLEATDAELLGAATSEDPTAVCPPHRWYPVPAAPPMAADVLGREPIHLRALVDELRWPHDVDVGIVETAGGVRSPIAHDGDGVALAAALQPDAVILVAHAGLGTINDVRLSVDALAHPVMVLLNRFDSHVDLHRRNRSWLEHVDGLDVYTDPHRLPLA